ncbi:MAG: ThuA domain-containing protein [Planctomycetes bacterium]|nr:ThuA domain-containing protein [Planctomycetota bacterium]
MRRRDFLVSTGAAALGTAMFPFRVSSASFQGRAKVLYFTRSVGFEHSVVSRKGNELSHSEKILVELGKQYDVEVVCTKDGTVFDGDLDQYDAIAFYTCGDLCHPESKDGAPPMTPKGKQSLLDAIAGGKGFVGFHSATDTFHSKGGQNVVQTELDPYIAMIGGEFIKHGPQQVATMRVTSPSFPGLSQAGRSFKLNEEWYAMKNFAKDMHVILVQETEGMEGNCYQRPPFPATWARQHGKGRVFYTSLGHREDVWTNPMCQDIFVGGFSWVMGEEEFRLVPNLDEVAPKAHELSAEL